MAKIIEKKLIAVEYETLGLPKQLLVSFLLRSLGLGTIIKIKGFGAIPSRPWLFPATYNHLGAGGLVQRGIRKNNPKQLGEYMWVGFNNSSVKKGFPGIERG